MALRLKTRSEDDTFALGPVSYTHLSGFAGLI